LAENAEGDALMWLQLLRRIEKRNRHRAHRQKV
jgi:hypothetical protein